MEEFLLRLCIAFPIYSARWCCKSFLCLFNRQQASQSYQPRSRCIRLRLAISVLAALCACIVPCIAAAQCPAGEILVAEDEDNWYCRAEDSYKGSQGEQLATDYCKTKAIIAADQAAIR